MVAAAYSVLVSTALEARAAAAGASSPRLKALDGLRGVAAAVVVAHHALLMAPVLSDAYLAPGGLPEDAPWIATVLVHSPLHLLWAGGEAVLLFFVLSGLVLTLPALRPGFSWVSYFPRRVVRLYLPVLAAVIFTAITLMIAPRTRVEGLGDWVNGHGTGYATGSFARDLLLVFGTSGVITPLWSLQWEVIFSVLLPLFVGVVLLLRRAVWLSAVVAGLAVAWGDLTANLPVFYLGIFAIGTVLGMAWPHLRRAADALRPRGVGAAFWVLVGAVAVYLTIGRWLVIGPAGATTASLPGAVSVVGVTLLVLAGGLCPPVRHLLETRPAQWLGRISFGLYLVHESILMATRFLGPTLPVLAVIAIAVPLCFIVAHQFTRWVELPSHALARRIGNVAEDSRSRLVERLVERAEGLVERAEGDARPTRRWASRAFLHARATPPAPIG